MDNNRANPIKNTIMPVKGNKYNLCLYKIQASQYWQCRFYHNGKYHKKSTETKDKKLAKIMAERFCEKTIPKAPKASKEPILPKEGRLYLIGLENEKNQEYQHIKLGFTTQSAYRRMGSMGTGMPFTDLYIIHETIMFPHAYEHEKYYHTRLKHKKTKREWFKLSMEEILELKDEMEEDAETCYDIGKGVFEGDYGTIYNQLYKTKLFP